MSGRSRIGSAVIPGLAALALVAAGISILRTAPPAIQVSPRIQPPGQPEPGLGSVSGAGLVEAESEQAGIGAVQPGMVLAVTAVPGVPVRAGDVLFTQDSRAADAAVAVRTSDVLAARAAMEQARSMVPGLRAQVDTARAVLTGAEVGQADAGDLLRSGENTPLGLSISRREMTKRRNDERAAEARLQEARGRLAQAEATLAQYVDGRTEGPVLRAAAAAVAQAEALQQQAETARSLLSVRAPFDGTVLQVNLRPGEYAQLGGPPAIVLGQLRSLRLRADIDEADIPRFDPAAAAVATPRGDPARRIPLHLVRVEPLVVPKASLTGAGTDRVDTRVLRVLYEIVGAADGLYPGQQLNLFVTGR